MGVALKQEERGRALHAREERGLSGVGAAVARDLTW